MKTIWKYPICRNAGKATGMIPEGAEFLSAHLQGEQACLWFLCSLDAPKRGRTFNIFPTGSVIEGDPGRFLATVLLGTGGLFVFHIFEAP